MYLAFFAIEFRNISNSLLHTQTHIHTHIYTQPNHTSVNWINNRVDTVEKRVNRIKISQQNWSKLKSTERGTKF